MLAFLFAVEQPDQLLDPVAAGTVDRHGERRERQTAAGVESQMQASACDVDTTGQRRPSVTGELNREGAGPGHPRNQAGHEVLVDVLDDEHGGPEASEAREDFRECGRAARRGSQRHDG